MIQRNSYLVVILLVLAAGNTGAVISLNTVWHVPRLSLGNETTVNLSITNNGDEPATDVKLDLMSEIGRPSSDIYWEMLSPGETGNGSFKIIFDDSIPPGSHPQKISLRYTNPRSEVYSLVFPAILNYGKVAYPLVRGRLSMLNLSEGGKADLKLMLENLDNADHKVKIKLLIPDELGVDISEQTIEISRKKTKIITYTLYTIASREGNDYMIYATIEYAREDMHYTSTAKGRVHITKMKEKTSYLSKKNVLGAFIVLIVLVYAYRILGGKDEKEGE